VSDRVSSGTLRALRVLLGAREKREGKSGRCDFFGKYSLFSILISEFQSRKKLEKLALLFYGDY
ncbi:MAG: hypothetical protein ACOC6E_03795, partial [Thermodesulfobacteriota bacterium]